MSIITFGLEQLDELKAKALAAPLKRARINLHEHLTDRVQEMVIAEHHTTYVRPHRHPGRLESFHVIEGSLTVVLFDDAGGIVEKVPLGEVPWKLKTFHEVGGSGLRRVPQGAPRPILYRQRESHWHTLLIESEFAVIHEVVEGPFPYETEWAPWSPRPEDAEAVEQFKAELRRKIA